MQAAERLFLRMGFSRISMDDLAKDLGMSKKTLYAHFASKEALVVAMLEYRTAGIESRLNEIVNAPSPFVEKFSELALFVQSKTGEISPAFLDDIRRFSPAGFQVIERFRARVIPLCFGRLIEEGVREGYVEESAPRDLLIRMVVLSIQGIVRPEVVSDLKVHPAAALDHILNIIFGGVLTTKGRKARRQLTMS